MQSDHRQARLTIQVCDKYKNVKALKILHRRSCCIHQPSKSNIIPVRKRYTVDQRRDLWPKSWLILILAVHTKDRHRHFSRAFSDKVCLSFPSAGHLVSRSLCGLRIRGAGCLKYSELAVSTDTQESRQRETTIRSDFCCPVAQFCLIPRWAK